MRSFPALASVLAGLGFLSLVVGCAADPAPNLEAEDSEVARNTTLTFFLAGQEYDDKTEEHKTVWLDSLNPELEAKGLKGFTKAITIGAQDGAKFTEIRERLAEANEKLGRDIELSEFWDLPEKNVCYNGTAAGVMRTVEGLRGTAFDTYMGVQAMRYGSRKKVWSFLDDPSEKEWIRYQREENGNDDTVEHWVKFDTRSDAFLMMTDFGQQGDSTELMAVLISRCR